MSKNVTNISNAFGDDLTELIQKRYIEIESISDPLTAAAALSAILGYHFIDINQTVVTNAGEKNWRPLVKEFFNDLLDKKNEYR